MTILSTAINWNAVFHACRQKRSDPFGQIVHSHHIRRDQHPPSQEARVWCHQLPHSHLISSNSIGQIREIYRKAINIPIQIPGNDDNIGKNCRPISLQCQAAKTLEELLLPKILRHITSTLAKMAFGQNTRHALHCRRSPPKLLPASQEKIRLTEQYSSRSI